MLVTVSAPLAERARTRAERERERKARMRKLWPSFSNPHHGPGRQDGRLPYSDYDFVVWDGEAPKDTGYSLFGSSLGHEICHPKLETEECFDLLLDAKRENPCTIFVIFGGRYDFDEIIRQKLPPDRLARIKWFGSVTWHGYTIRQCEGKWFSVARDGVTARVDEIFGWFHCKYVKALRDYGIGTEAELELLESEKNRRSEFLWTEIEEIREYMRLELKLGVALMERIREICLQAGFSPRAWYGPSALATMLLNRNKIKKHMAKCPPEVNRAAQFAYAGGRFEMFRGGIIGPVYSADINSAYPTAMLELPSLANGTWRHGKSYEAGKFAVYRIRFTHGKRFDHSTPMPLFRRLPNGTVTWPASVDSWYWAPEARLVANDPRCKFIESWVFDETTSIRPFAFVSEVYRKRKLLQRTGSPAELPFKWALNSIYGQLCRTVGWNEVNKKLPPFHQLEWAGYVTSWCRAKVHRLALQAGDKLIAIDTDSVTAMCPLSVQEGDGLGEWKVTEATQGLFYQSGVYFLRKGSDWNYARLRGIDYRTKTPPIRPEILESSIRSGRDVRIKPRARYISVRQSLNWGLKLQGQWVTSEDLETLKFGGQGKRQHNAKRCAELCSGDIHIFVPVGNLGSICPGDPTIDFEKILYRSEPHKLPWLGGEKVDRNLLEDLLWADAERIDSDDYWLAELI